MEIPMVQTIHIKPRRRPVTGGMTEEQRRAHHLAQQKESSLRRKLWYNIGKNPDLIARLNDYYYQTYGVHIPLEYIEALHKYMKHYAEYFAQNPVQNT